MTIAAAFPYVPEFKILKYRRETSTHPVNNLYYEFSQNFPRLYKFYNCFLVSDLNALDVCYYDPDKNFLDRWVSSAHQLY